MWRITAVRAGRGNDVINFYLGLRRRNNYMRPSSETIRDRRYPRCGIAPRPRSIIAGLNFRGRRARWVESHFYIRAMVIYGVHPTKSSFVTHRAYYA